MGLTVDELDIYSASYETAKSKLEKNDIIYVAGGNTFYLLQELKRTGTDKLLADEINKRQALHRRVGRRNTYGAGYRLFCRNG